jgi:glycerophosphoryl diester phosphodiesterase
MPRRTPPRWRRTALALTTVVTAAVAPVAGSSAAWAGVGASADLGASTVSAASAGSHSRVGRFDLQAHRGGLGLVVESTLASFANGLETGVSTLEMDVQITEDGQAVVTHDRKVSAAKCRDTGPVQPGDPEYPYVGKYVVHLSLAQVRTLDCGSQTLAEFPGQRPSPGARMPLLTEVFALVHRYRAYGVRLNIETKVEAGAPQETAPREQFVQVVAAQVRRSGLRRQVTIESFDWGALMRMRQVEPRLPIIALTNGQQFLQAGEPGRSPWLGGLDIDDFGGDLVAAADSFGADAISPVHGMPQNGKVTEPGYRPYVTQAMVADAHAAGMRVIPWTVDDEPTMRKLIDDGVDGLITDYPDRLRGVMAQYGMHLPRRYCAPR